MNKFKPKKISISQIEKFADPYSIKNFILSDNIRVPEEFSLNEPFIFNGILFGLCLKGSAKLKINFKEYILKPNAVLVTMPNQVINIIERSDDFFIENLFVSIDFIANFPLPRDFEILSNIGHWPCLEISHNSMEDLLSYHTMILKQYNQVEQPYRIEIVKGLLYAMLMEMIGLYTLKEEIKIKPHSRSEEVTNQFFKLLRTYFKEERNVSFYADKLCLSAKYLSSIIKQVTGESILSWIHEAIIVESKMLLKSSDMTVLQISDELNFPNPSFFGKFFKEHTNLTPLEFRDME